ncbi:uncharacterized protein LOC125370153 [Ricinus communis]|uniref:uncharacterized protein LOC125370153 n=1 Tax=Ricinus communis TaxID=3988 RepID=UPI00201ADBAC|nr:uncharacterized protein LOC125370153 [Ricinus communis]
MEGSLLLESLDSLWFFSNLFSSRTQPIMSPSSEGITNEEDPTKLTKPIVPSQPNESPKAELLSPRKPLKSIVYSQQQNESPKVESLSPRCSKCGEYAAEIKWPVDVERIISQEAEFRKHEKKEERSSSSRGKRKSKRKILGELDLGLDHTGTYLRDCGVWEIDYKANGCDFGLFGSQQHFVKMPPLSDGIAMKEHLKSWAYAVACTVR